MTQPMPNRDAYTAAGLTLAGFVAWAVPAVALSANTTWVALLLVYTLVAAGGAWWLAARGADLLAGVEREAPRIAVLLIVVAACALIALNVWQTVTFAPGIYAEDTAYYGQVLWNTLHGDFLAGNVQQARLYDPPVTSDLALHVSPVLLLLLPFYAIYPDPLTLLIVRDIVLAAAAWPLFLIARERLGGVGAVAAVLLYLANPIVLAQGTAAFYLLQLAPLPFFYAVRAFLQRRFAAFALATAAALALREDVSFTFGAFGVLALLLRYPLRWGIFGCAVPVLWWGVTTMLIQPAFGRAGNSVFDAALAGGDDPLGVYGQLLTLGWLWAALDGAGTYLWQLLGWSAYVGVLGLEALLAAPAVLMHLFLGRVSFDGLDVYSRFTVLPTAALVAATVVVTGRLFKRTAGDRSAVYVAAMLLLPATSLLDGGKDLAQRTLELVVVGNDRALLREGLAQVPAAATVAAPYYALPSLANRSGLYFLEFLAEYRDAEPEYVLADRDLDRLWLNAATSPAYDALLQELLTGPDYAVAWQGGEYVLFRRVAR